ncbi:hypothetical protein [Amycolatopsis sp. NPDC051903]|uniref:hypothetical protein n=1 Tax=Amycolatopsis sp. NPDC051903 TaxID=3363936 RepID=UPI0037ACC938
MPRLAKRRRHIGENPAELARAPKVEEEVEPAVLLLFEVTEQTVMAIMGGLPWGASEQDEDGDVVVA